MRLIDADKLKEIWTIASPEPYNTDAAEVLDSIDEQPTVYDIDKVIEQLKNVSCHMKDVYGHEEHLVFTDHAIDIVKKGGV